MGEVVGFGREVASLAALKGSLRTAALADHRLNDGEFRVFSAVLDWVHRENDDRRGEVWLAVPRIAAKCSKQTRAVQRALTKLVALGYLVCLSRSGGRGADGKAATATFSLPVAAPRLPTPSSATPLTPSPATPKPLDREPVESSDPIGSRITPVTDPIKELWNRGLAVLGGATPQARSLLGKLRKQHGDIAVLNSISQCEAEQPSDPAAYLIRCCEARGTHHANRKQSPASTFFEVGPQAVDAVMERQELHEREGGFDRTADEPLLAR